MNSDSPGSASLPEEQLTGHGQQHQLQQCDHGPQEEQYLALSYEVSFRILMMMLLVGHMHRAAFDVNLSS
jgi:hypothetical protein